MENISWDVGIIAFVSILGAYSLLIKRAKAYAALIAVYIAYCTASIWGKSVAEFFAGDRSFSSVWIKANANEFSGSVFLFAIVGVLLLFFLKIGSRRGKFSLPETVIYVILASALAVVCLLSFMTPVQRELVLSGSKIAEYIYQYREWVMGVPVFMMVFFGIYGLDD